LAADHDETVLLGKLAEQAQDPQGLLMRNRWDRRLRDQASDLAAPRSIRAGA
jgi:hypothetical protein